MKFAFLEAFIKDAYVFDVEDNCVRYILSGKKREDLGVMKGIVLAAGYTVAQETHIGENDFVTLRGEEGDVVLGYYNYNHTLSIVTDALGARSRLPLAPTPYETKTTPKLGYLGLHGEIEGGNDNGMGMVYVLSDGSFIVYDGGYWSDAPGLLAFLEKHNVRDEKPRIAAWVLTHSHGDHYGALATIAGEHSDRLTVEAFILKPRRLKLEFEQYEPFLAENFESAVHAKFPDAAVMAPHTGQHLYFRDAVVEILSTEEEILPQHFRWLNETSIYSRVFLGGQSILLPGDAELAIDVLIPTVWGDALKSDFMQHMHHAFSGGSFTLFDLVHPDVVLWTCNNRVLEKYWKPTYNNGYNYYLKELAKENYVYDDGDVVFELPYRVKE